MRATAFRYAPRVLRNIVLLCVLAMSCKSTETQKTASGSATGSSTGSAEATTTAAGQQFNAWLAAFNGGDRATLIAYHEKFFPYSPDKGPPDVDGELSFRQNTGGFEIKKVEEATATHVAVLLKERGSDQFARAVMDVEAAPPHRVTKYEIKAIPTPDGFRTPRMSEADALKALRAELERSVAKDAFAGAIIVAKNGKQIFAEAYGFADREKQIKNTLDTRFRIGSMNKMFTAVATLQLVQAGKLAVNDTLAKAVPKYPNQSFAKKVTIHHLLTHTGGTGDIFGPDFDKHRLELRTLQDYVKLYGNRELEYEPGQRWQYSNYGFLLLGVVIETLSKQSYYDYVAAQVFKPAGMTSTSSPMEDKATEPNRSIGYMKPEPSSAWQPNVSTLPIRATSAGGGDSTVKDLIAFANALSEHKLLDAERTKLLMTGKTETPGGGNYAYGMAEHIEDGVRCVGHGGGAPGMNGDLSICDSGYTIAVLANVDPPAADRISRFIVARLPAK